MSNYYFTLTIKRCIPVIFVLQYAVYVPKLFLTLFKFVSVQEMVRSDILQEVPLC